jgi:hypothetical protein
MISLPSPQTLGTRRGKQIREDIRVLGSRRTCDADTPYTGFTRSLEAAGYDSFGGGPAPTTTLFQLLPPCSPVSQSWTGKRKTAPRGRPKSLISLGKTGEGEGIRTLDPNLCNVHVQPSYGIGSVECPP